MPGSTWRITKDMLLDWVGSIKDRANLAFEGKREELNSVEDDFF